MFQLGESRSQVDTGPSNHHAPPPAFQQLHPRLKVVDYHVGSQFFIAILSDETGFVTVHIEPDAEGSVERIIICSSIWSSLPFSEIQ
jgi:hypothetical protein